MHCQTDGSYSECEFDMYSDGVSEISLTQQIEGYGEARTILRKVKSEDASDPSWRVTVHLPEAKSKEDVQKYGIEGIEQALDRSSVVFDIPIKNVRNIKDEYVVIAPKDVTSNGLHICLVVPTPTCSGFAKKLGRTIQQHEIDRLIQFCKDDLGKKKRAMMRIYRYATNTYDIIAKYLLFYLILEAAHKKQPKIDEFIKSIDKSVPCESNPKRGAKNKHITIYTKLRNSIAHPMTDENMSAIMDQLTVHVAKLQKFSRKALDDMQ